MAVSDGTFCATGTVLVTLDATPPGFDVADSTYPTDGYLNVPLDGTSTVNLVLTGRSLLINPTAI